MRFAIESYLENAAKKFIRDFDPCCYLYLSRAIDWYDISEGYPDMKTAFEGMKLQSSKIIGVETDFLWPPHQQKEIADCFARAGVKSELQMLDSIQGHDAFLVDMDAFRPVICDFLA